MQVRYILKQFVCNNVRLKCRAVAIPNEEQITAGFCNDDS